VAKKKCAVLFCTVAKKISDHPSITQELPGAPLKIYAESLVA
jgi:hypothetical protein